MVSESNHFSRGLFSDYPVFFILERVNRLQGYCVLVISRLRGSVRTENVGAGFIIAVLQAGNQILIRPYLKGEGRLPYILGVPGGEPQALRVAEEFRPVYQAYFVA